MAYSFRQFVENSDIQSVISGSNLVLFFKKDNELFGAPEESRLIFARIKHPEADDPKGWGKEASFTAINLTKALSGDKSAQSIFTAKDLKNMKIIDPEQVASSLKPTKALQVKLLTVEPEDGIPQNMSQLKDKK